MRPAGVRPAAAGAECWRPALWWATRYAMLCMLLRADLDVQRAQRALLQPRQAEVEHFARRLAARQQLHPRLGTLRRQAGKQASIEGSAAAGFKVAMEGT